MIVSGIFKPRDCAFNNLYLETSFETLFIHLVFHVVRVSGRIVVSPPCNNRL